MLSLTDLLALAPTLQPCPSFMYFHENQLAYPTRTPSPRDHHFGFTQLVSARAATCCGFNSQFNLDSFLEQAEILLKALPDAVPSGWVDEICAKSRVLPVPVTLDDLWSGTSTTFDDAGPMILWNHRWEHDKNPEAFFEALSAADDAGRSFRLALAGPRYSKWPTCFDEAKDRWPERTIHFGPCVTRAEYRALLQSADIAISTAEHEFLGVSMIEASHAGAFVLVPDRLSYPEVFPASCRYTDQRDLIARLIDAIDSWRAGAPLRADRRERTLRFGRPALEAIAKVFGDLAGRPVALVSVVSDAGL